MCHQEENSPLFMRDECYKDRAKFRKYNNLIHARFLCCQRTCDLSSKRLLKGGKCSHRPSPWSECILQSSYHISIKRNTEPCHNLVQNQKVGEDMQVNLLIHSKRKCSGISPALSTQNVIDLFSTHVRLSSTKTCGYITN